MAEPQPFRFGQALRTTLRRTLQASGRAPRSELVAALIAFVVAVPLVSALLSLSGLQDPAWYRFGAVLLLSTPFAGLLMRRFHDHGRSGWLILLPLLSYGLWIARALVSLTGGLAARLRFEGYLGPLDWLAIAANITTVVLALLPGTVGPNRFGPDPRETAE